MMTTNIVSRSSMSTSLPDRLLSTFLNVQRRLEAQLELCRTHEHPSWMSDDDWGELHRFCGPYRSDIEELENSIASVSTLLESLRSESQSSDNASPLPDYPLCKNGWTLEKIERLDGDDRTRSQSRDSRAATVTDIGCLYS